MYLLNFDYKSKIGTILSIEALVTEDQIKKIKVWNDNLAINISFEAMLIFDQENIIDEIWERCTLELLADAKKRDLGEEFRKVWSETMDASYIRWLNEGKI